MQRRCVVDDDRSKVNVASPSLLTGTATVFQPFVITFQDYFQGLSRTGTIEWE
jgi:hypothetical protein